MAARDIESALLARCAAVARDVTPVAQDQREANVFMLAAMLFQSHFPREAKSFLQVSEQYFATTLIPHMLEAIIAGDRGFR